MREGEEHVLGAISAYDIDRVNKAASGVNLVIDQQHVFAFDTADQRKRAWTFGIVDAAFFDKRQWRAQRFRPIAALLGKAQIGRNNDQIIQLTGDQFLLDIIAKQVERGQRIARDI